MVSTGDALLMMNCCDAGGVSGDYDGGYGDCCCCYYDCGDEMMRISRSSFPGYEPA